jgi:hypothetical protein
MEWGMVLLFSLTARSRLGMPEAGQNIFFRKCKMDKFARPFADDVKPVLRSL